MSVKTHVEVDHEEEMSDSESQSDELEIGEDLGGDDEDFSTDDEAAEHNNAEAMENKHSNKGDNPGRGLANTMAKILNKQIPQNMCAILAKGSTEREIQKKKRSSETKQEQATVATAEKKTLWEEMARVKPNPLERDRERRLQKIATRGVVQLFNAVRKQQKSVEEKLSAVGSSERKRSKVLESVTKGAFLDLLRGTRVNVSKDGATELRKPSHQTAPEDTGEEGKWDILREDFMMGASLKDWDKEQSGDEGGAGDRL